ncbi:MAG TPA: alpha/beta hydrolase [Burkholderiaceae bacterium]
MPLTAPSGAQRTFAMGSQQVEYCMFEPPAARATVLFLPGLFAGAWMWTQAFDYAAQRGYRAVAVNAAFAKIPVLCKDPIAQFRAALDGLLSELPTQPLLVCGNSLGGLAALDYAVNGRHPCRVLASGIPGIGKVNLPGLILQKTPSKEEALVVAQAIFHDRTLVSDAMLTDALSCFEREHFAHLLRYLLAVRHYPLLVAIQRLRRPMTLIWGEQDRITPLGPWEDTLADDIVTGRIAVIRIAACGHSPMLEKPEEFNRHLGSALAALHAPTPETAALPA